MSGSRGVAILVGAGDAIGAAVARRFAKGGYAICICLRDAAKSQGVVDELDVHAADGTVSPVQSGPVANAPAGATGSSATCTAVNVTFPLLVTVKVYGMVVPTLQTEVLVLTLTMLSLGARGVT